MADVFKLPRVRAADSIADTSGKASNAFVRFWDTVMKSIERQENAQSDVLAQLLAVQQEQADQLALILEATGLANAAQATADTALSVATAAATGAATDMTTVTGSFATTSWATLAELVFPDRLAVGYWTVMVSLSGSTAGTGQTDVEFQVIEAGASSPLTSASTGVPNGPDTVITLDFDPTGPLPQTQPAGDITVRLQGRKVVAGNATSVSGAFAATYIPSP